MVVAEEDDVESAHLLGHLQRLVLAVFCSGDTVVLTRMEQAHDQIGMLIGFDVGHPLACRLHHVVESQPAPQFFSKPTWDGGGQHADDRNAHAVPLYYCIRSQVRLSRLSVYDVGSQEGVVHCLFPSVVNMMACFHVVVAYGLGIIPHVVADPCRDIGLGRIYEIREVAHGLALQDVAVVEQHHRVSFLPQLPHVVAHACQRPRLGLSRDVVVGEEASVYVARLDDMDLHCPWFCCHSEYAAA